MQNQMEKTIAGPTYYLLSGPKYPPLRAIYVQLSVLGGFLVDDEMILGIGGR